MRIDWYTKAVLTVIAVALVAIAGEVYVLPAEAQTQVWVAGGTINVSNAGEIGAAVALWQ